jgi:hypothetical protein
MKTHAEDHELSSNIPVNPGASGQQNAANPADDLFNPERLRLAQNFDEMIGVKKILTTVPVRRPDRQSFTRVHPDPAYRIEAAVVELDEERETYLVEPRLVYELPGEVVAKVLFTAMNRQGVVFLWPVRLPGPDGRHDPWNKSALQAAEMAMKNWVRVVSNRSLGGYDVYAATADWPEPEWPELSFRQLLEIAFADKLIRSLDHPVIQKLQGLK